MITNKDTCQSNMKMDSPPPPLVYSGYFHLKPITKPIFWQLQSTCIKTSISIKRIWGFNPIPYSFFP